jgi:nucleoside-diphosphate-sugar epimerase
VGISKLTGEHLIGLYRKNFGLISVNLRLFSVYGPFQRPDMLFARLFEASLGSGALTLAGDGTQSRDFVTASDVVEALLAAGFSDIEGETINIGSGSTVSVANCVEMIEGLTRRKLRIEYTELPAHEAKITYADISKAKRLLGFEPRYAVEEGLTHQWNARKGMA